MNNIKEVKKILSDYEELVEKSKRLIDGNFSVESVEMANDDDYLLIGYYCWTWEQTQYETVPISWLFLSDEDLSKAKEEKRREEEERKRRIKMLENQKHEEEERAEYERLRKKFEGEN